MKFGSFEMAKWFSIRNYQDPARKRPSFSVAAERFLALARTVFGLSFLEGGGYMPDALPSFSRDCAKGLAYLLSALYACREANVAVQDSAL